MSTLKKKYLIGSISPLRSLKFISLYLKYRVTGRERSGISKAYFTGCIRALIIDDKSINFAEKNGDTLEQAGLRPCVPCEGRPCGDNGKCIPDQDGEKFKCQCSNQYTGKLCDHRGKLE